jgi:hypothetical protein
VRTSRCSIGNRLIGSTAIIDSGTFLHFRREFVASYNRDRPHRTLGFHTPEPRPRPKAGPIHSRPVLNGLHHVYERTA